MPEIELQKDTLCVKLPCFVKEELMIKNLHPDIEDVRIPRQKRAKFCLIKFKDPEKCLKVKNELKGKTIEGKPILVTFGKKKIFKPGKNCIKLVVMKLPNGIHKKEVKKAIPTAAKVKIRRPNKKRKFTWALLIFEKKNAAKKLVASKTLNIKGIDVQVHYYKKKGKKYKLLNEKKPIKKPKQEKKESNNLQRYFEVSLNKTDSASNSDSSDTELSDNSDAESFDLEYDGCFDSDSD